MKNIKLISLILTVVMVLGIFASCADSQNKGTDGSVSDSASDSQTTLGENNDDNSNEDLDDEPVIISVTDAKGSAGLVGDMKAIFAPETDGEKIVSGPENNSVPYQIYAVLSSPTVITNLVLTAPTEDQVLMGGATIDGSVNGTDWVNLKIIGNTMTSGKTYTLNIGDETAYSYIRIRQNEERRTEKFVFRNLLIKGLPQTGSAGSLNNITEETDDSLPINISSYYASSTLQGEYTDVFLDNSNSWTSKASSTGKPNYLIAIMSKKTELRRITVKLWGSNSSACGTVIQASEDGAAWDDLYTVPTLEGETGEFTASVSGNKTYSYVRIKQSEDLVQNSWTLNSVLIYGVETTEDVAEFPAKYVLSETVAATYLDSHVVPLGSTQDPASIWDTSDKSSIFTHKEHPNLTSREMFWISATLANPTVITELTYYLPESYANRVRTSYFEASTDGVEWVRIATMPGGTPPYANVSTITLTVNDDTEYQYIRLVQGESMYTYYWTLGTVEIKGVCNISE